MMYSSYKLNKQGDNIQSWCTPFPIWNQSVVPCPVLTVASWPVFRFLKRQIRWSCILISFRISKDITLPTKVHIVKAMVFPVIKYGCESWTIKKAKHQRTDAFELWWRRLESPLDCKEIQPVHPISVLNIYWKDWCWSWSSDISATWCEEPTL